MERKKELSKCKWRKHTYVEGRKRAISALLLVLCVYTSNKDVIERERWWWWWWCRIRRREDKSESVFFSYRLLVITSICQLVLIHSFIHSICPIQLDSDKTRFRIFLSYYSTVNRTIYRVIATITWWYLKFSQTTSKINRYIENEEKYVRMSVNYTNMIFVLYSTRNDIQIVIFALRMSEKNVIELSCDEGRQLFEKLLLTTKAERWRRRRRTKSCRYKQ